MSRAVAKLSETKKAASPERALGAKVVAKAAAVGLERDLPRSPVSGSISTEHLSTDPTAQPFRDTAIYNPHLLSKPEVIGIFHARRSILEALLEDFSRCRPGETAQHHLLIGMRGMGKTMLLRRLRFAIEDDPRFASDWLALSFPEEQYNVGHLSDFWVNCLEALGDWLESHGEASAASALDEELESLDEPREDRRAEKALRLLVKQSVDLGRRFVLLIDNIDLIFERIGEQSWALREALSERPEWVLVGASARALEVSYEYGKPFYDFFHIHELAGLDLEEARGLLRHYAEHWQDPAVLHILEEEPARIQALHTLTGGNPRNLTLLYNILGRGLEADVRGDLENLLDHCTPLYKARLEALSPQKQRVMHALAAHWHPATAAAVAEELRLDVRAASSQLTRLVRDGLVEQVAYDPATKVGFQLAERFFNIWYLMRGTRRSRRRMIWLVEFLRMFYSQSGLGSHGEGNLNREVSPMEGHRMASGSAFNEARWSETVLFFREAVAAGKVEEAMALLERQGFAERWQPLMAALAAVADGRQAYLNRLAPEVRKPAEEILQALGALGALS